MEQYIRITLIKSTIGAQPRQKRTVSALGLGKLNSSVVQRDNSQIRGMIHKVRHLLKVEPAENAGNGKA